MKEYNIGLYKRTLKAGEESAVSNLIERAFLSPYEMHNTLISGSFELKTGTIRYITLYKERDQQLYVSISSTYLKEKVDISIFPSLKVLLGEPTEVFVKNDAKDEDGPQITFKYNDLLVIS